MAARTNDNKTDAKRYSVSQLAVERAKAKNIDTSRAAKEIRSILRRDFGTIVGLDPTVAKAKSAPNDGNRWPAMNEAVRDHVKNSRRRAPVETS